MSWNPYAGKKDRWHLAGRPEHDITEVRASRRNPRTGTHLYSANERLIGGNGEVNAGSKRELMSNISNLLDHHRGGRIEKSATASYRQLQMEKTALVREAIADKSGEAFQVLGEVIGDEIWETLGREGFARRILMVKPLGKGETGRVSIRKKDVVAYMVTSDVNVVAARVRQDYLYPPEFYLISNIEIEDKDIEQATGDLMDDKYQDGLEQILVREDQILKGLLDNAAGSVNDTTFFNSFTPTIFTSINTLVRRWGLTTATAIIAYDIWDDIIADSEFSAWWDPVSKHELIMEGGLGSILNVEIVTDGFRYDTLQVLDAGEVYFLASPQTLGAITQRKELSVEAINKYNQGRPTRGWFMEQIEGMVVANSRAVAKGLRA